MRGVLAAEDRAGLGHHLLDERVADARAHGHAAVLADHFGHRVRDDEVVHDRLAGMPVEDAGRDDRGGGRPAHRLAGVVDEEHPVGVTVEGEPDVGAEIEHRALQVLEVLELDRVGGMVRERAVELAVEDGERERKALEHLRHDEPAHAVRGVGHDRERTQHRGVDEGSHVVAERLEEVEVLDLARDLAARRDARRDHLLDLGEPGLLADRRRARAAQLDAVVLRGVVAGGEHRAGRVELAGREVDDVGGAEPDVGHVGAGEGRALDERGRERHRRRAHVVADDDLLRAREVGKRVADTAREVLVDLFGIQPAHVVGLENRVERQEWLLRRIRPTGGAHGIAGPARSTQDGRHGSGVAGFSGVALVRRRRTRLGVVVVGPRGSLRSARGPSSPRAGRGRRSRAACRSDRASRPW